MTAFDVFREYVALKTHFTTRYYDYFKFNGQLRSTKTKNYENRKDKVFFLKLAKHKDAKNFLIANFIENDHFWVGDLVYNEQAETNYKNWSKRVQSLSYNFKNELSYLKDNFDDNFIVENNDHPYILKLLLRGEISLETVVILTDLARCYSYWNKKMKGEPVWENISIKIKKYKPFMNYDKEKMKQIVVDKYT